MRFHGVPVSFVLFLVAFVAGVLTLVLVIPSSEGSHEAVLPPCDGLPPAADGAVRLRGIVDHTEEAAESLLVYLRVEAVRSDIEREVPPVAVGDITFVSLPRDHTLAPEIEPGSCLLVRARYGRYSCGPACTALGYFARDVSLRARPE